MLIYDLVDLQELQGYVRQVQAEIERDEFTLRQFLPNNAIDDIEFRVNRRSRQDFDAATVRNWDTEAPIAARRAEFRRLVGELPPVSRKIQLGEEERLRMRALQLPAQDQAIVDAVFDDAAHMARAVTARFEMFRAEALSTGQIAIDENGVEQTVDFGRDAAAEVTAPLAWSDPSADIVTDLTNWRQEYRELNDGELPAFALTSDRVISLAQRNEQFAALAGRDFTVEPNLLSEDAVQAVLRAYRLPPFVPYEKFVRVNGVRQRLIPDNLVILLPRNPLDLGETLFGTTAEALELVGAQQLEQSQAPGLTAVVQKTFDPVHTWTKAAAVGLPVLYEPNLAFVADTDIV